MSDQAYTLFPPEGACNEVLPAQHVTDEYTFVELAPIEAVRNGQTVGAMKLPRDVIAPERVAAIRELNPEVPYDVLGKTPAIWMSAWRKRIEPSQAGYNAPAVADVKVKDVSSFVAAPRVQVGKATKRVLLEEHNVRALLSGEPTLVGTVPSNGGRRNLVRLVPRGAARTMQPPLIVPDVHDFLTTGRLAINGDEHSFDLTDENVSELSGSGITMLRLGGGRTATSVYAVSSALVVGGDQPTSASYAATAAPKTISPEQYGVKSLPPELLKTPERIAEMTEAAFFTDGSLALYLPYRITWTLLGYTRGELLNTISLEPDETASIEVTTWDRLKQEQEEATSFESQFASEMSLSAKRTAEAVNDLAHQHNWGLTAKGDVSIPMGAAKIGAGGTWSDSQSMNDTHKGSVGVVIEGLRKVTAQIKTTRQTKVNLSREVGTDRRVTRQIKNNNLCHTLDLDYFEILASYKVSMKPLLDDARICLLVDNPISDEIAPPFVLTYESELREALLSSDQLPGFDAVRTLAAFGHLREYECMIKCPEPCPCEKPPPAEPTEGEGDPLAEATKEVATVAAEVRERIKLLNDADVYRNHTANSHDPPAGICALARDIFGSHPGEEWDAAIAEWQRWLFREIHLRRHATGFWSEALRYLKDNDDSPRRLELLIKQGDVGWASVLNQAVAAIFSSIQLTGIAANLTAACNLNIKPLLDHAAFDDAGLDGAMSEARAVLEGYNSAKAAKAASDVTKSKDTTAQEVAAPPPPYDAKTLAEARVRQDELLAHLSKHQCYYRQAVWARLGRDDRLVLLRLFDDVARNAEPEIVGFLGDKCAFPLRHDQHPEIAKWLKKNILDNKALKKEVEPVVVTLPTPGVTQNSRLGQCSTCEDFIEAHRALDLEQKRAEVDEANERAKQEKLETQRYQARLDHHPHALLDDPDPTHNEPVVHVVLDKPSA
jgi:hypothetical protein